MEKSKAPQVIPSPESDVSSLLLKKAETELDLRIADVNVRKVNALANYEKVRLEGVRLQQEERRLLLQEKRLALDERRLALDEKQSLFDMSSELAGKPDKVQKTIKDMMFGLLPKKDKQVVALMNAARKVSAIMEKEL